MVTSRRRNAERGPVRRQRVRWTRPRLPPLLLPTLGEAPHSTTRTDAEQRGVQLLAHTTSRPLALGGILISPRALRAPWTFLWHTATHASC